MESQSNVTQRQPAEAEAELRKKLDEAIKQRNVDYKLVFLVTMSFETDDAGAKADSKAFAAAMKELFGLIDENIFEFVFPMDMHADLHWVRTIPDWIQKLKDSCTGRKLLLLHFAGHGALNSLGELELQGNQSRTPYKQALHWINLSEFLLRPNRTELHGEVDVTFFLDCCYSGAFVAPVQLSDKTVEVLAATDAGSLTTTRSSHNITATFTQRLIYEMRSMAYDEGKPIVTFPEILKRMQNRKQDSPKSKPVYRMLFGEVPILLPVKSLDRPPPASTAVPSDPLALESWRPQEHSLALKVHINSSINDKSTRVIVQWLHKLRGEFGMELVGVNDTNSTTIVFLTVPYTSLYVLYRLELRGVCKLEVIHENLYSRNLLSMMMHS
ncbi:hypothetical protein AOL_s00076g111 [Orbilia oligospora ATCC 24927]|uniref:Peptidase C14 caspase domain-containing protein n=1 Tax=Arthrobotrys oligospora (strain ATCC 24927 / CBS 115.81 / DSM 1491) TaxID=756982 RepID=G1X904_ARTOA|nr:hypothetical protein AOL_s00076g111 [Orbilia oligospora ATCC 24927]EGX50347.1 hypothetical protein AOL_s00076g111 [Orbilia oligospora ATCC 24927]